MRCPAQSMSEMIQIKNLKTKRELCMWYNNKRTRKQLRSDTTVNKIRILRIYIYIYYYYTRFSINGINGEREYTLFDTKNHYRI